MLINNKDPFLIGVAGGISSGKSSVCKKIIEELAKLNSLHNKQVLIISLDSFYKEISAEDLAKAERGEYNFDHPDAYDDELAYNTLISLLNENGFDANDKNGSTKVKVPVYDKKNYRLTDKSLEVERCGNDRPDVIILEGVLTFYYPKIRDLCQMKLFVDCDADTRLSRRVMRDLQEYKRPLDRILDYYQRFVKPAFEEFCLPTKKYADVIIPRGSENIVAINLIVQHINDILHAHHNNSSSTAHNMSNLSPNSSSHDLNASPLFNNRSSSSLNGDQQHQLQQSSSSSNLLQQQSPRVASKRNEPSTRPH